MNFLKWIIDRGKEASTYAGLAGLLAAIHMSVPDDLFKAVTALGIALSGLAAIILKDTNA